MYQFLSGFSYIVRFILCYFTIETTPIFANSLLAWGVDQMISIYFVLMVFSYLIVGNVFKYERGSMPELGVVLYFFTYVILALITWGVLALLTAVGILPLAME